MCSEVFDQEHVWVGSFSSNAELWSRAWWI